MCTVAGRHDEALAIAERGRTRAFADLLVERQKGSQHSSATDPYIPVTVEHMVETVNSQRALVLYYSVAGGFLYSWLIAPGTGKREPKKGPQTSPQTILISLRHILLPIRLALACFPSANVREHVPVSILRMHQKLMLHHS